MLLTEWVKLLVDVFSTLVIAQCLDFASKSVLSLSFKLLENSKHLILSSHGDYIAIALVVINEGHLVVHPRGSTHRERPMDIRMDKVEWMGQHEWLTKGVGQH